MFKVGELYTYHDHTSGIKHDGDVTFVSHDYIVLCIHRELKTPEEARGARSKWREVKILVYKAHFDQLIPRTNDSIQESPISSPQARRDSRTT
ncbi:hypothetical protein PHM2_049 [Prochlorococcus phage P-HM2]|uniref:Uncharacterized protein n=1 Tax=Prochlorococcus phage P-HM2 TaxID=445696 RepID=E3SSP9_9CAUD|nr:hypothetical protein PHM2_049 [Prochlorococcus phage P-HM2]ADO99827.1 hypothetical protein PHM2_049 [Prochlorococcus phage P-HM2]|tara:strand:+ start:233 stop:511 length:279 start_codon:yes stop_codon:yes gene_type:complete